MLTIGGAGEVRIEVIFVPPSLLVVAAENIGCEGVHGGGCECESASDIQS